MQEPQDKAHASILRKIKRCLALSESSNEQEAATALRQAQALMTKYRITEQDVAQASIGEVMAADPKLRLKKWERSLGAAVCDVFNCRSLIGTRSRGRRVVATYLNFVGVTPAPEIAQYAYRALHAKAAHDRLIYVRWARVNRRDARVTAETLGDHFAQAWVEEVHTKLEALVPKEDAPAEAGSDGRALVLVKGAELALVNKYLSEKGIGSSKGGRKVELDLHAIRCGFAMGAEAQLHHGVGTGGQQQALIGGAA
ncbi:hypothetical protein BJP27_24490 (plasmid) [Pseudomonas oryzihabitans]|nr:hypothetical protein BJP27_24490 [Pseudomonas psychrotolerans]